METRCDESVKRPFIENAAAAPHPRIRYATLRSQTSELPCKVIFTEPFGYQVRTADGKKYWATRIEGDLYKNGQPILVPIHSIN